MGNKISDLKMQLQISLSQNCICGSATSFTALKKIAVFVNCNLYHVYSKLTLYFSTCCVTRVSFVSPTVPCPSQSCDLGALLSVGVGVALFSVGVGVAVFGVSVKPLVLCYATGVTLLFRSQ